MSRKKKILFEVLHPAHVHLFKNFIFYLQKKDIEFLLVSRDKDITNQLLNHYKIPYVSISKARTGFWGLLAEAVIRDFKVFKLQLKHKFDYAFTTGTSFAPAHVSFITKLRVFNFMEDDDEVVNLFTKIAYPFTEKIIVPDCLRFKRFKNKRILYPSYHELAYLHPDNFTPDEHVLKKYGLEKRKFVILRLSALKAHHDFGAKGINADLKEKIKNQLKDYYIVESLEGVKGNKIDPWDMHHVLAFAKMIISDSQTMTIEGAVLGIPSMRINTFIGKSTVIEELEQKYQLAYGFLPENELDILNTINSLAGNQKIHDVWSEKKHKILLDKIDLNRWMIDYFENRISFHIENNQ